MQGLLFKDRVPVADGIEFHIHTIGEIMEFGEEQYFRSIALFLADPFDYMLPLHEMGVDYETINEFELFVTLMGQLSPETMQFLFDDTLSFEGMLLAQDHQNDDQLVLVDPENPERIFGPTTLFLLADVIRQVHYYEHEIKKAGNKAAKAYFLELAKKRARRKKNQVAKSVLEPLVLALVNAPEFPYDYNTCKDVTIYQFLSSVHKIPKRLLWNFIMHGVHVGMIDAQKLDWKELDWMS